MFDLNPKFHRTLNHNPNYKYRYNNNTDVQFRLDTTEEDPGVCSPPLWQSNSSFPDLKDLSQASRAQAIARGQREMMAMVETMPEASYELSLKDIVEQRREYMDASVDETQSMEDGEQRLILGGEDRQRRRKNKSGSVKRQESGKTGKPTMVKTGSMDHNKGFLINMFFPFSIGSKKKKSSVRTNSYSDNSYKHVTGVKSPSTAELLSVGGDRRDWWKKVSSGVKSSPTTELLSVGGDRKNWWKKVSDSGYSESLGVTSSSSGESTGRSGSSGSSGSSMGGSLRNNSERIETDCNQGCWPLFPYRKKKYEG